MVTDPVAGEAGTIVIGSPVEPATAPKLKSLTPAAAPEAQVPSPLKNVELVPPDGT